jgi:hypothetical protein
LLTRSDFARLKGWSKSYVTKLGEQGRLVLSPDGKKVDVSATLALLAKSGDPGKVHVAQRHAADRIERDVGQHVRHDAPACDEPPAGGASAASADASYWKTKSRRESALAEMAELELHERLGKLVDRERVEATVDALYRTLRDALLGLPTRLAPEISAMTDAFEIEVKMRDAIRSLLTDLSNKTAQDLGVQTSGENDGV